MHLRSAVKIVPFSYPFSAPALTVLSYKTKPNNSPVFPDALIIRRAALKLENWAITGEGSLDGSSSLGLVWLAKRPYGIAHMCFISQD